MHRLQKQVTAAAHIVTQQEAEVGKLNAIIAEADAERARQARELAVILSERNTLQNQLVRRDEELGGMYERLRVQRSALANGAAAYTAAVAQRDELVVRVGGLRGALLVARTQSADAGSLAAAARALEADVLAERTRAAALADELRTPLNVHRWRGLADTDPQRWAALQRVHALQARLADATTAAAAGAATIAAREDELAQLQAALDRLPPPRASAELIAAHEAALATRGKQLRRLVAEVEDARAAVGEHRAELARVASSLDALSVQYVRQQRAAQLRGEQQRQQERHQLTAGGGGGGGADGTAAAGAGQPAPLDAAALLTLDVTAELAAAPLVPDGHGGMVVAPADVAAVKAAADALLGAYFPAPPAAAAAAGALDAAAAAKAAQSHRAPVTQLET